jgi:DNA adenine methylase
MTFNASSQALMRSTPLIKWPGGKRALLDAIIPVLPNCPNRYYEPFLGGGALFFALQSPSAVLSDTNEELINLYVHVRDSPNELISLLKQYVNSEAAYYCIRADNPIAPIQRAARLLYLTTLSFNGIHRVNLKGQFNVPYGKKTHLPTCNVEKILSASRALSTSKIIVSDFEKATEEAGNGDLVYFDPPYTVAHAHNGFVKYNEKIFSWDDQVRLANHASTLLKRGCNVIVSNADHASVAELYEDFECLRIERHSVIAASNAYRRKITEVLYYKRPRTANWQPNP